MGANRSTADPSLCKAGLRNIMPLASTASVRPSVRVYARCGIGGRRSPLGRASALRPSYASERGCESFPFIGLHAAAGRRKADLAMNYAAMGRERAREGEKFAWAVQSRDKRTNWAPTDPPDRSMGLHRSKRPTFHDIVGRTTVTPPESAVAFNRLCHNNALNAHGWVGERKREFHAFQMQN